METEGKIYEIIRKIQNTGTQENKWQKELIKVEEDLIIAKDGFVQRLPKMDDIPILTLIGD